jgi:hypothetical protein
MSWQALDWVRRQKVGHAHSKAVLVQLANFADDRATCFPSHEYLAEQVEVSERTIQECMKKLEAEGYLTTARDRLDNGRLGITRYTLCLDRQADQPPEAASGGHHRKDGAEPPEGDAPATGSCFRSDTPEIHQENLEREAQAREGEEGDHVPNADLLVELKGKAIRVSHDSPAAIDAAWRRLTPAERREAVDRYLDWVADAGGVRKAIAGLPVYLAEKRWTMLPPKAGRAAGGRFVAPAFSKDWAIIWHKRVAAGKPVGPMVEQARRGLPWGADPEPTDAEREAFVKVFVGSPEWDQLCRNMVARWGIPPPKPDLVDWISAPAELLGGSEEAAA